MTFWDHLEDLRKSVFRMVAALIGLTVLLFFFKEFLFDDVILAPTEKDFYLYRLLGVDFALSLVNIEVSAQFMIHMKVTFICALILSFPYLVYELWNFVAPALYERERNAVKGAFTFAGALFYIGLAVGYFVILPLMINFFAGYQVSTDVPNHGAFIGYAPYEDPEIAIAVRIANGYSSANAAIVARNVISYYYGQQEESELITGHATQAAQNYATMD
jgi:sec-independent protein translocase protein TatC